MNKEQFKICYDQFFDPIRNYVYYKSGDDELATDIAQHVFMQVWEKQLDYTEQIKSLLYKMANDRFIDHIRKNKVADKYVEHIRFQTKSSVSPQETLEFEELKKRYEDGLANLPEGQREVFLMSRMDELTYREISESLGVSIKAVEKRMSNALSKLKKILVK